MRIPVFRLFWTEIVAVLFAAAAHASFIGNPLYAEYYYDLRSENDNPPIDFQTVVIGPGRDFVLVIPIGPIASGALIRLDLDTTTIAMEIDAQCQVCEEDFIVGALIFDGWQNPGILFNELRLQDREGVLPDFTDIQLVSTDLVPAFPSSRLHVSPDEIVFDFSGYGALPDDPPSTRLLRHLNFEVTFASAASVPEPAASPLLALCLAGLAASRARKGGDMKRLAGFLLLRRTR